MKKIVWMILIIIALTGCNKKEEVKEIKKDDKEEIVEIEEKKEEYIDTNPIKIAFYTGNGSYKKLNSFSSKVEAFKEIGIFSILLSDEDEVSGSNRKSLYKELSSKYENFNNYKIGYSVKFETTDGEVHENILKPQVYNSYSFGEYLYVWLYDDINTTGWHSHIEPEEYNDNTVLSSIKLMWGNNSEKITSNIELSVFTYDADDFDELGHYRGNSISSVIIEKN